MRLMEIRRQIEDAITHTLAELGITATVPVVLEYPADITHGDYSTNVALVYAKVTQKNPKLLAEEIVTHLGSIDGVAKIEIAGPGFINFTLAPQAVATSLEQARATDMWGANTTLKGEQILMEYTSPNLFKPLHIGNLVGNILGESIARLMQFSGGTVMRLNYPSDIGPTVAKGVWGLIQTKGSPKDIKALGEAYRTGNDGYENSPAAKTEIDAINKKLYEESDPILNELRRLGIETSRAHLDALCAKLGTNFDTEIFESEAGPVGQKIVMEHMADGIFEKSDGAVVFSGEQSGLHTRVFINSAGLPTYEAKDLGNFFLKQQKYPQWTESFVVTGVEQQEYFKVIIAAIKKVFPTAEGKRIEHIPTGFLTLTTGKMSSRKGNVLTGESLIADLEESAKERAAESRAENHDKLAEQIAVAAIKYQILKQGSGKNIIFDREKALSMEGDSGPYLQYTYARTCAISIKAKESGVVAEINADAAPNDVTRLLVRFPEIVAHASEVLEPHLVTQYLLLLAAAFNSWYAQEQILDGTPEAAHKVAVVEALSRTLKNGLWILGIPAPEQI